MPNTLVHFGIQGVATRTIIREADFKWIMLGTIIPDIPWIARRIAMAAIPTVVLLICVSMLSSNLLYFSV